MWLADAAEVVFYPGNKKQLTSHPRRAPFLSQNLISSIVDDPEGGTGSGAEVEMEGRQVKKSFFREASGRLCKRSQACLHTAVFTAAVKF